MDISALLAEEANLLIMVPSKGRLQQLTDLARQSGDHIGIVSPGAPLLTGISVGENIALPGMFHFNQTMEQILARLDEAVDILGMAKRLDANPANISRRDCLKVQLLRCMVQGSGIVLMQAPRPIEARLALEAIKSLGSPLRLWVSCLLRHTKQFRDLNLKQTAALEELS